jgi:acetoin utilization protein AcuB
MFVIERMTKDLITAPPEMKIAEARQLMLGKKIRHLPVVDETGLLIGIVSDRDMRDAMPSILLKKDDYEITVGKIMNRPVSDIMTKNPITVYIFYTIQDVLLVMRQHRVGALPVVDENGYLKGIVSTRDLLRAFVNVMGIDEPGTLLCILSDDKQGQMKKIVDIIAEEKISLGSVLVSKTLEEKKKAIFPYLFTNNVITVKKRLLEIGFEMLDPMQWYLNQVPKKKE